MRPSDPSYGSDNHGMVWGYHFVPNQPAQTITSDAALEWLGTEAEATPGEFLWLHFSLANAASKSWLHNNLKLPDSYFDSLQSDVGSTRLEQDADALVAVIHDVLFDFTFDPSSVATTSLCIGPRLLVSARLHPLRSVDQLRTVVREGQPFRSALELLATLLRAQAGVLADILRQSTQRTDSIEDRLLTNRVSVNRGELGSLRRVLVRLQRLLAPEPAALFRLLNRPSAWMSEEDVQDLRQAAEEFSVAVGDTVALVERVKLLQEELGAQVNEQTNRTLYVLTVVTVLALPVNLLAGLFGMNVGGVPFGDHPHGFLLIAVSLLGLSGILAWRVLGRQRD